MDDLDDLLEWEQDLLQEELEDRGTLICVIFGAQRNFFFSNNSRACKLFALHLHCVKTGVVYAGPPLKRVRAACDPEELGDDELLALAQTPLPELNKGSAGVAIPAAHHASAFPSTTTESAKEATFISTQEALEEEQEIAELVRLANTAVPLGANAAGQHSHDEMPESSAAAAERMQEACTSYRVSTEAPSWSGANIEGDSMTITLQDGRRAFCRLHAQPGSAPARTVLSCNKLLTAPIVSMMQDVEQEAFAKALQDSQLAQNQPNRLSVEAEAAKVSTSYQSQQRTLWVDKYSPKSFFELLSADQINREVVKWVKSWDSCVHQKQSGQGAHIKAQPGPEQRLLLLSGPPGNLHTCCASHITSA